MRAVGLPAVLVAMAVCLNVVVGLAQAEAPATQQAERTFMWQASSDTNTVHLLGSVHLGDPSFYPLPVEIERAFDAAETIVVEVDITRLDQVKLMGEMMRKGMYPAGESLRDHLPAKTMQKLEQYLAEQKLPLDLGRFRPWAVQMTLATLKLQQLGLVANLGIDQHLLTVAHAEGKAVEELESADLQIEILSSLDEAVSAEALDETLDQMDEMGPLMEKMMAAWKRGDAEVLHQVLIDSSAHSDATRRLFERLFDERNVTMTGKIEGYLKGATPTMVIVGAGHLTGEKGIVRLLRERGYKVEQVEASGERGTRVPGELRAPTTRTGALEAVPAE